MVNKIHDFVVILTILYYLFPLLWCDTMWFSVTWCRNIKDVSLLLPNGLAHSETLAWEDLPSSTGIYLLKINNRNTRARCEICSKLTIKTLERRSKLITETLSKVWNMFKVNNKNTKATPMASVWCLYWELWTYFTPCSSVFIVNFENVIADWDLIYNIAWYILFII